MESKSPWRVLVTGGAGFIGSALVRQLIRETDTTVINLDKLTYAGNLDSLAEARDHPRHHLESVDIGDYEEVARCFREHQPEAVVHLAAESHVDRSIQGPATFMQTNILGTYALLEAARSYWEGLEGARREAFRFLHVSTDEVYGDLGPDDVPFAEEDPYAPSSPYSASKASSDHLVRAWHRTYGLPVLITNCSNNYGPYQFPEKLIPLMILNGLAGSPLPVYGDGQNVRDWLHVDDHARALRTVLERGHCGRTYNIGGRSERTNLAVVQDICACLDELAPREEGPHEPLIEFVGDRPGHDRRYAIDDSRLRRELGWAPRETFGSGLRSTVHWYMENPKWVERVRTGVYREWLETNYGNRGAAGQAALR